MLFFVMLIGGTSIYTVIRVLIRKKYGYDLPIFPHKISLSEEDSGRNILGVLVLMGSAVLATLIFMGLYNIFGI